MLNRRGMIGSAIAGIAGWFGGKTATAETATPKPHNCDCGQKHEKLKVVRGYFVDSEGGRIEGKLIFRGETRFPFDIPDVQICEFWHKHPITGVEYEMNDGFKFTWDLRQWTRADGADFTISSAAC